MRTEHSIDYADIKEKCFATFEIDESCSLLRKKEEGCGTAQCPFYKPEGFKEWKELRTGTVSTSYRRKNTGDRT